MPIKLIVAAGLLVLTFGTGFRVSGLGRPLHPVVFGVHKILAVGCIVLAVLGGLTVKPQLTASLPALILLVGTVVLILGTLATGVVLSFDKLASDLFVLSHRFISVLLIISVIATFVFLKDTIQPEQMPGLYHIVKITGVKVDLLGQHNLAYFKFISTVELDEVNTRRQL